jgi:hypothetical protein
MLSAWQISGGSGFSPSSQAGIPLLYFSVSPQLLTGLSDQAMQKNWLAPSNEVNWTQWRMVYGSERVRWSARECSTVLPRRDAFGVEADRIHGAAFGTFMFFRLW